MCLSIPGKVIAIKDDIAQIDIGGVINQAGIHLVDDVQIGDWVLVHSGYILQKIDEQEAQNNIKIYQEIIDPAPAN
jgi:hydrogenase expression/formation protein HypC